MSKPNRLARESSPYLRQHAQNPVDWYPWGGEALERARKENRPIFLSIGYSACHWCHVMEKESFEDESTAKVMNENFINIKVDREERQDLDHIYMSAVQVLTQRGGWPMSVFLTPDLRPFYGGTYFPPTDRMGLPSFKKVLMGVSSAWAQRRDEVNTTATQLTQAISDLNQSPGTKDGDTIGVELIDQAAHHIATGFDAEYGGFGGAPKFFHTMALRVCLRHWRKHRDEKSRLIVEHTLHQMRRGGIYDQLGGGFHRYSTDRQWLVPHFEKMLYDNALLVSAYLESYQAFKNPDFAGTARETLDYVLREMTSKQGAFFSTQDADTEGVEGKFYVWSRKEILELLGEDQGETFCCVYGVSEKGNFEHQNILNLEKPLEERAKELSMDLPFLEDALASAKRKLLAAREKRVAPHRDEKVLVSWNGLMIDAMAFGFQVLHDERYLAAAQKAASFLLEAMGTGQDGTGKLLHTYKEGKSKLGGYLDDYACFIYGLVTLYEADADPRWITAAAGLTQTLLREFWDAKQKTFFFTSKDHEKLITRPKELQDGATPSGLSMAVTGLIRLGRITGDARPVEVAEQTLASMATWLKEMPTATAQSLIATALLLDSPEEYVLIASDAELRSSILETIHGEFLPQKVLVSAPGKDAGLEKVITLLKGKTEVAGKPTLYICRNSSCQSPIVGDAAIREYLAGTV